MIGNFRGFLTAFLCVLVAGGVTVTTGCASDSYAAKGAAEGATSGAVAGAVGGMVSALVFGGNIAEAGARGAVYGGSTGAVLGGMSGSKADKAVAAQMQAEREADLERFRTEIGADAYNGVVALAECKHEIAIANAREAAKSNKSDFALAGVWVEVLTEADRRHEQKARAMFPEIIERDGEIDTEADAEARMHEALQELGNIRVEYDLSASCSGS
jgi:hypothetical protein